MLAVANTSEWKHQPRIHGLPWEWSMTPKQLFLTSWHIAAFGSNLSAHSATVPAHRPQLNNVEGAAHLVSWLAPRASVVLSTNQSRTTHALAENNIAGVLGDGLGCTRSRSNRSEDSDAIGRSISLGSPSSAKPPWIESPKLSKLATGYFYASASGKDTTCIGDDLSAHDLSLHPVFEDLCQMSSQTSPPRCG